MLLLSGYILFLVIKQHGGQINLQSDIDVFSKGTQFQPVNAVELFSTILVSSFINCAQGKTI